MSSPKNPAACCVLESPLDDEQATILASQLKALADPVRLRLFSLIASSPTGDACACELPGAVDRSQPTVSHHLSQLVDAGLLEREQRGKWAWFRIADSQLASIRMALGEGAGHHEQRLAGSVLSGSAVASSTSCCGC
ncbi:MAG TPA: metalloregulator ArsR/SmtB family transcription factor [Ilumatobacter sp.]|nr:metalloregulator ArsR/SmtB family transcription factor [Ilumatobacter sp.]